MKLRGKLSKLNAAYLRLPFYFRLPIALFVICIIVIATQDIQLFPGALFGLFISNQRDPAKLPPGVESRFIDTQDGERLEVWRLSPTSGSAKKTAVIFHGNAADVENFFPYQRYFAAIGITSYGFDYRGFGKSSGWPSQAGLAEDSRAVVEHILQSERITPHELIIVGISIGSGPAARAAARYHPGILLLFSPFSSLADAVRDNPLFGMLYRFLLYRFPVADDAASLNDACVILVHGEKDTVISPKHSAVIAERAARLHPQRILHADAGHNDILFKAHAKVTEALRSCL